MLFYFVRVLAVRLPVKASPKELASAWNLAIGDQEKIKSIAQREREGAMEQAELEEGRIWAGQLSKTLAVEC